MNKFYLVLFVLSFFLNSTLEAAILEEDSKQPERKSLCRIMDIKGLPQDLKKIAKLTKAPTLEENIPESMQTNAHFDSLRIMLNNFKHLYLDAKKGILKPCRIFREFEKAPEHGTETLWALYPFLKRDEVREFYLTQGPAFNSMSQEEYDQAIQGMKFLMLYIDPRPEV